MSVRWYLYSASAANRASRLSRLVQGAVPAVQQVPQAIIDALAYAAQSDFRFPRGLVARLLPEFDYEIMVVRASDPAGGMWSVGQAV